MQFKRGLLFISIATVVWAGSTPSQIARYKRCALHARVVAADPTREGLDKLITEIKMHEDPGARDLAAYECLGSHPYFASVVRTSAKRFGLTKDEAEDLYQKVFLRFQKYQMKHFDNPTGMIGYIADNLAKNMLRQKTRERYHTRSYAIDEDETVAGDRGRPLENLVAKDELERTLAKVDRLIPTQREAILLMIEFPEATYEERGAMMTSPLTLKGYKSLLTRARRNLEKLMAE